MRLQEKRERRRQRKAARRALSTPRNTQQKAQVERYLTAVYARMLFDLLNSIPLYPAAQS